MEIETTWHCTLLAESCRHFLHSYGWKVHARQPPPPLSWTTTTNYFCFYCCRWCKIRNGDILTKTNKQNNQKQQTKTTKKEKQTTTTVKRLNQGWLLCCCALSALWYSVILFFLSFLDVLSKSSESRQTFWILYPESRALVLAS